MGFPKDMFLFCIIHTQSTTKKKIDIDVYVCFENTFFFPARNLLAERLPHNLRATLTKLHSLCMSLCPALSVVHPLYYQTVNIEIIILIFFSFFNVFCASLAEERKKNLQNVKILRTLCVSCGAGCE